MLCFSHLFGKVHGSVLIKGALSYRRLRSSGYFASKYSSYFPFVPYIPLSITIISQLMILFQSQKVLLGLCSSNWWLTGRRVDCYNQHKTVLLLDVNPFELPVDLHTLLKHSHLNFKYRNPQTWVKYCIAVHSTSFCFVFFHLQFKNHYKYSTYNALMLN